MKRSDLKPEDCKCRGEDLATLVARWRKRTLQRVVDAVESGGAGVDIRKVQTEAKLLANLAAGGKWAFEGNNPSLGHLCDECPYRKRTPLRSSLAVDPPKTKG